MLVDAAASGRKFRVIIADGRPKFEGREMARNMVNAGIKSSYIQVSTVPYVMPEVRAFLRIVSSTSKALLNHEKKVPASNPKLKTQFFRLFRYDLLFIRFLF